MSGKDISETEHGSDEGNMSGQDKVVSRGAINKKKVSTEYRTNPYRYPDDESDQDFFPRPVNTNRTDRQMEGEPEQVVRQKPKKKKQNRLS